MYGRTGHRWQYGTCALHARYLRVQTHTQCMQHVLLSHCKNGCTNAPKCYVIYTLPVLFAITVTRILICKWYQLSLNTSAGTGLYLTFHPPPRNKLGHIIQRRSFQGPMCAQTTSLFVCTRYVLFYTEPRRVRKLMSGSHCQSIVDVILLQAGLSLLISDMSTRKPVTAAEAVGVNLFWLFYIDLSAVGWGKMGWKRSVDFKFCYDWYGTCSYVGSFTEDMRGGTEVSHTCANHYSVGIA
jgi:hypothetical protein